MSKLVLSTDGGWGRSLRALAAALSERLNYRVYCVRSSRVRNRFPIYFFGGIDKCRQFKLFQQAGLSIPQFAFSLDGARMLECRNLAVRELTNASEGRGLSIVSREACTIGAPLYTEYIPKKKEFRVHVFNNRVIDVQEKRKRREFDGERNTQVRNTANGYVFCRDGLVEPDDLRSLALAAVSALQTHHGAVDVIWNESRNKCYVLEVNSRPGLEGTTLEKYVNACLEKLND